MVASDGIEIKHQINNAKIPWHDRIGMLLYAERLERGSVCVTGRVMPKRFRIIAGAARASGSVDAAKRYFGRSPSSWPTVAEPGNLRGEDVYHAKLKGDS